MQVYNRRNRGIICHQGNAVRGVKLHAIPILSGWAIVWGGYTSVTCDINYIALPVMIIGIICYCLSKEDIC